MYSYKLKKEYYQNLTCISIVVTVSLLSCFTGTAILETGSKHLSFYIDESVITGCIGLFSIVIFAILLLNPEKKEKEIERIITREKKELEHESEDAEVDLDRFIRPYNKIETICTQWADYCATKKPIFESYHGKIFPKLTYSLRILQKCEVIDSKLLNELEKLRVRRNALVHSTQAIKIALSQCERMELIAKVLEEAFDDFKQELEKNPDDEYLYRASNMSREKINCELY